jgi:hypothetical protein
MKAWVTFVIWVVVMAGSIYFPFIRSPKMTNAQLLRSYWWFYLPAIVSIVLVTIVGHRPWRRR